MIIEITDEDWDRLCFYLGTAAGSYLKDQSLSPEERTEEGQKVSDLMNRLQDGVQHS